MVLPQTEISRNSGLYHMPFPSISMVPIKTRLTIPFCTIYNIFAILNYGLRNLKFGEVKKHL